MKHTHANNQEINGDTRLDDRQPQQGGDDAACDNLTAEQGESDNVADKQSADDKKAETQEQEPQTDSTPQQEEVDWRDKYIRLQAEFDNFRKRTLREKMDLIQSGGSDVLKAMLPVLDDVLRALEASKKSDDLAALRKGEELVAQKFVDALRQKNVTEIEAQDADFNPDLHEAVAKFAAGEDKKGKVIDVVQRGYMLGDKVLRFAKVVVGE
ncbi:MAG: nucleotide exchange factor GrpE [Alistipes sp.]